MDRDLFKALPWTSRIAFFIWRALDDAGWIFNLEYLDNADPTGRLDGLEGPTPSRFRMVPHTIAVYPPSFSIPCDGRFMLAHVTQAQRQEMLPRDAGHSRRSRRSGPLNNCVHGVQGQCAPASMGSDGNAVADCGGTARAKFRKNVTQECASPTVDQIPLRLLIERHVYGAKVKQPRSRAIHQLSLNDRSASA